MPFPAATGDSGKVTKMGVHQPAGKLMFDSVIRLPKYSLIIRLSAFEISPAHRIHIIR
jgi:hypothetical protein